MDIAIYIAGVVVFSIVGGIAGNHIGYSIKLAKLGKTKDFSYVRLATSLISIILLIVIFGELNQIQKTDFGVLKYLPAIMSVLFFYVMFQFSVKVNNQENNSQSDA